VGGQLTAWLISGLPVFPFLLLFICQSILIFLSLSSFLRLLSFVHLCSSWFYYVSICQFSSFFLFYHPRCLSLLQFCLLYALIIHLYICQSNLIFLSLFLFPFHLSFLLFNFLLIVMNNLLINSVFFFLSLPFLFLYFCHVLSFRVLFIC
jgi:hypothetical protein